LVVSRLIALAVSMLEPPPTATYASNGPFSFACSIAARRLTSVGSTWHAVVGPCVDAELSIASATRCGLPVAATPLSVTTSTLVTPSWARSKPISSAAPAPNLSAGEP
jgi:hypothetical protein